MSVQKCFEQGLLPSGLGPKYAVSWGTVKRI